MDASYVRGGVRLQNEEVHIKSCFLYIFFIEIGDKEL